MIIEISVVLRQGENIEEAVKNVLDAPEFYLKDM